MARKTLSQGVTPARTGHYADYPACLPNYKWLVELALKNPEIMFNVPTSSGPSYCKCCGSAYHRKDYTAHVHEHAVQLKLRVNGAAAAFDPQPDEPIQGSLLPAVAEFVKGGDDTAEILMTILDSLKEKMPDLELDWTESEETIADALVFDVALETEESEIGEAPMCDDCKEG